MCMSSPRGIAYGRRMTTPKRKKRKQRTTPDERADYGAFIFDLVSKPVLWVIAAAVAIREFFS